ncbi:carbohydrate ABC transporter permease [Kallotenue papyrolyticum]|uniref:carbohydrate ABC transporter permease n=1 Tax=Kallotenue papyrolyticum TaxID=1325125 RepID=UPI0009DF3440|nr:sugar ABC transporter permease [Kallotenue papyrolyticum]
MSGQVTTQSAERVVPAPPARRRRRRYLAPTLLLAPTVLFLLFFFAWPMVQALVLAVQDRAGVWTLDPLRRMINDINFWPAVRNTLLLIVVLVPLQVTLALVMALLLNAGLRGTGLFLYAWAVPLAISDLAAGIVWLSIFADRGYLNSLLAGLGLPTFAFLSYEHPVSMFIAVVIAETWRATAIVMVILVAGLQVIPKEYGEAAAVFGATGWQRLRHVTLPLLRPSLQVALILRTILAFQVFAVVIALAGRNMPVLASEAYYWYGSYSNPHVAAAYALIILAFSMVNTLIYLRTLRVRDEQIGG